MQTAKLMIVKHDPNKQGKILKAIWWITIAFLLIVAIVNVLIPLLEQRATIPGSGNIIIEVGEWQTQAK